MTEPTEIVQGLTEHEVRQLHSFLGRTTMGYIRTSEVKVVYALYNALDKTIKEIDNGEAD